MKKSGTVSGLHWSCEPQPASEGLTMEEERDGRLPIGGGGGGGGRAAPPPGEEWSLEDHPREWEVVVMDRRALLYEDDFSVFPPSDHEGLLVEQAPMAAAEGRSAVVASPLSSPPSLSSAGNGGESRWPVRCHLQRKGERWPLVELARRAFDSGIERLWFKLPRPSVGAVPAGMKGGTIWSFTAVAGLTALLLYSNHRYRREKLRLLLLIKEKDQTITWLSQHIAQMNELMAARLIVPVARSA